MSKFCWWLVLVTMTAFVVACKHDLQDAPDLVDVANSKFHALSQPAAKNVQPQFEQYFCHALSFYHPERGDPNGCASYFHRISGEPLFTPLQDKTFSGDVRVLFVPGIFGECLQGAVGFFSNARAHLERATLTNGRFSSDVIPVSGYSSSSQNARKIARYIRRHYRINNEKVVLVGYSKGATDIMEFLVRYPEAAKNVDAVVSVAGVILGSTLADKSKLTAELLRKTYLPCRGDDGKGINSLKSSIRAEFLKKYQLPAHISYYSISGITSYLQTSLALRPLWRATASASTLNDSQVVFSDSILPGSKVLGFVKADHWAIALPFDTDNPILANTVVNRNSFPREAMLEAALSLIIADF